MKREGSVTKVALKNNKGVAYEYWQCRYYDNTGKQKRKLFPPTQEGQREAKAFQKAMTKLKGNGELVSTSQTVSSWLDEYITTFKKNKLRESSRERIIQSYAKIEASAIGNVPLDKVNAAMVQRFYNQLAGTWTDNNGKEQKRLSSSSIKKIHVLLSEAYRKALQLNLIARNPMDAIEAPKVTTKEMTIFTDEEITKIFEAISTLENYKHNTSGLHNYRLLFMMLLACGFRIGELLALKWEDINLAGREIHVHSTKSTDKQEFHSAKTKSGDRLIPIIYDHLLQDLKDYRGRDGVTRLTGFVFANRTGGAISYQRVLLTWQRICELAGIEGKTIHTFRHTCATRLLEKGVPTAEVARILGHSEAATTLRLYTHAIKNYNEKIIEQLRGADVVTKPVKKVSR